MKTFKCRTEFIILAEDMEAANKKVYEVIDKRKVDVFTEVVVYQY